MLIILLLIINLKQGQGHQIFDKKTTVISGKFVTSFLIVIKNKIIGKNHSKF